jgi:hypothetical protein
MQNSTEKRPKGKKPAILWYEEALGGPRKLADPVEVLGKI